MSETVTVACKLPHGLVLRVFDMKPVEEPLPGGGTKKVAKAFARLQTVTLNGYLEKYTPGLAPAAKGSSYALTHGVDKEFFDVWMKQNHDLDAVRNGLIFSDEKPDMLLDQAREFADTRSGLEPVDPSKLKGRIQTFEATA
jgi:hypothetical protein